MVLLVDVLPEFVAELEGLLTAAKREDVAHQLREAMILRCTHDPSCDAVYIYVQSSRPLNVVEANIIGVRHEETIPVESRYWANLDMDNFGRLQGIELLCGGEAADRLAAIAVL